MRRYGFVDWTDKIYDYLNDNGIDNDWYFKNFDKGVNSLMLELDRNDDSLEDVYNYFHDVFDGSNIEFFVNDEIGKSRMFDGIPIKKFVFYDKDEYNNAINNEGEEYVYEAVVYAQGFLKQKYWKEAEELIVKDITHLYRGVANTKLGTDGRNLVKSIAITDFNPDGDTARIEITVVTTREIFRSERNSLSKFLVNYMDNVIAPEYEKFSGYMNVDDYYDIYGEDAIDYDDLTEEEYENGYDSEVYIFEEDYIELELQ